jgi:hypothetical protein
MNMKGLERVCHDTNEVLADKQSRKDSSVPSHWFESKSYRNERGVHQLRRTVRNKNITSLYAESVFDFSVHLSLHVEQ